MSQALGIAFAATYAGNVRIEEVGSDYRRELGEILPCGNAYGIPCADLIAAGQGVLAKDQKGQWAISQLDHK